MTVLSPMTEAEFDTYLAMAVPEFARDKIDAGQWAPQQALELARQDYAESLPQGLATPDNFLYTVRDVVAGAVVGMLWFAVKERAGQRTAFVYDVSIQPEYQRQGHASRAFAALELEVQKRGLTGIALHVFGHNIGAQALYSKLGYVTTNINMFKPLATA